MKTKTQYRIRNWPEYNAALVSRGSLTLWVDEEAIKAWRYSGPTQRGAQYVYTDAAIKCVLTLRAVYHLALRAIRRQGRRQWKKESAYHRRSLAETAFFRFKTLFGPTLQARHFDQQATELFLKAAALNRMTHLGMPDSYRVAA